MNPTNIFSFSLGLIFGGILTAAISINEIKILRKMVSSNTNKRAEKGLAVAPEVLKDNIDKYQDISRMNVVN
jgi:hypothetical protein